MSWQDWWTFVQFHLSLSLLAVGGAVTLAPVHTSPPPVIGHTGRIGDSLPDAAPGSDGATDRLRAR